jgi:hypothetical protein
MATETTVIQLRGRVSTLEERLERLRAGQRLLQSVRESLDEVVHLPEDWDSYGAASPTGAAVSAAHLLLGSLWVRLGDRVDEGAVPWAIAPLADGGVQFEWRGSGGAIEVEISPRGTLNYLVERGDKTVARSDPSVGSPPDEVLDEVRRVLAR